MKKMRGVFTAIVTPFDQTGELDEKGLRHNLRFQIKNGVDGIVVLGTTGESPTLSHSEKERILSIAVEEVKGKAHLLAGTGSYSTQQTIENTRLAKDIGVDAALIVTPYYNRPTQEGLFRHFEAISNAVDLPICVYNIQGRTGQNIQTETLKRISSLPTIIGVKEASGNILQMNEVLDSIARVHPHFSVLSGDDALTLPLLSLGGDGVISVVSNLIPKPLKQLVDYGLEGQFEQARALHYQLLPIFQAAFIETNPIPIKTAMDMCGMPAGMCRLPLCNLLPENKVKMQTILQKLPQEWLS
jgi:4-hydroxy-tetrahydrodipicolinate synthase